MAIHGHESPEWEQRKQKTNVHHDPNSGPYGLACEIQKNMAGDVMFQCMFHC